MNNPNTLPAEDPQLLCRAMIDLLEREYQMLENRLQIDMEDLLIEKRALTERMMAADAHFRETGSPAPQGMRGLSEQLMRLSERNMAILRGRIDGLQAVIDVLRQREVTGVYGPDGTPVVGPDAVRLLETV